MSVRRPGMRRVVGTAQKVRDLDYVRFNRRVIRGAEKLEEDQRTLLKQAKAGDIGALCILKERWGVRLPAVEGRVRYSLPWMGR